MKSVSTAKQAEKLGLCFFKHYKNKAYYLCKELKNYNHNEHPTGLKVVFSHPRLKIIKAFLAELTKKNERKEQEKLINEGISKRAEYLANLRNTKKLKPANNEPSLFDFVS